MLWLGPTALTAHSGSYLLKAMDHLRIPPVDILNDPPPGGDITRHHSGLRGRATAQTNKQTPSTKKTIKQSWSRQEVEYLSASPEQTTACKKRRLHHCP